MLNFIHFSPVALCEGFIQSESSHPEAWGTKRFPQIRSTFEFPEDADSTLVNVNNTDHLWILGGRYKYRSYELSRQSIYINLNEWKHVIGEGLTSRVVRLSPAIKRGPRLPFKRFNHCVVNIESEVVYIIGGFNETGHFQTDIFAYNVGSDEWSTIEASNSIPCAAAQHHNSGHQTNCAYFVSVVKLLYQQEE